MIRFLLVLTLSLVFLVSIFANPVNAVTTLTCSDDLTNLVSITEYTPTATTEWVEIVNMDQNRAINLSGCTIVYTPSSGDTTTVNLTGTIGRGALLTFALPTGTLNDTEGKIAFNNTTGIIHQVSYGTYPLPVGAPHHINSVAEADKSNCINLDANSWSATCTTTKGWCNPVGFGECPTMSTIASMMTSAGVTTNLTSQTDYSRTTDLYFEMTDRGRITFLSPINFTDRYALQWMQTLDQKLDLSVPGRISLDATLIRDLADTNAQLTMYGLTLADPQIMVDGAADSSGIVSGVTYNRSTGTLVFTAAHFTTFTAVERTTSASSAGTVKAPTCSDPPPSNAPHLFQIYTSGNSAKLFFTPANDNLSYYYVAYGLSNNDERFGVSYSHGLSKGVVDYSVQGLLPKTTYYFKVRGGNGCAPGPWSNILSAKTMGKNQTVIKNPQKQVLESQPAVQLNSAEDIPEKPTNPDIKADTVRENQTPAPEIPTPPAKKSIWQRLLDIIFKRNY